MKDNRNYKYSDSEITKRREFEVIEKWIEKGSKIVDLGSGDGTLLKKLKDEKQINGVGIEISPSGVSFARKKGVKSVVGRIDTKLPYKNKEFDYAICNVTLQMVMYPEILIKEMHRISRKQIITFPNFGFFLNRLELLFLGTFPSWGLFSYKWFSTGEIHQLTLKDFEVFCRENKIKIIKRGHLFPGPIARLGGLFQGFSNLFATLGVFMTE